MRHSAARVFMVGVALALALGACSGGSDSSAERRDVPRRAPKTTTTAAPARIDLSQPIPGGSLHGTPRPPLENTGDDYVAIFESLDAQIRWLGENPDPTVVSEVYVPGTEDHDTGVSNFQFLASNGYRWADHAYRIEAVDVLDVRQDAVSLRFTDSMEYERVVAHDGSQVGDLKARSPETKSWSVLLTRDAEGRWRIADVGPWRGPTVQL